MSAFMRHAAKSGVWQPRLAAFKRDGGLVVNESPVAALAIEAGPLDQKTAARFALLRRATPEQIRAAGFGDDAWERLRRTVHR